MATTLKTKNSVTAASAPSSLAQGELAVNITDKKVWVGNASSTPVQIVGSGATNAAGGSNTQVQYNSSGALAGSANFVFDGTNVGIGAATTSKLGVYGSFTKSTGDENTWGIRVSDTQAMAAGVGGGLVFTGYYTSGGASAGFASISGVKENATTANGLGNLVFYTTNVSSVLTERMRITGAGQLLVGATSSTFGAGSGYMAGFKGTASQTYISLARSGTNLDSDGMVLGVDTGSANILVRESLPLYFYTNNSLRMQINAGAPILCLAGGSTSATGTGIAFPATQSASSDANTLDDYEEGTWTPTDASGAGLSITTTVATYTKIGRLVIASYNITYPTTASGAAAIIGGLPFQASPSSNNNWQGGVIVWTNKSVNYTNMALGQTTTATFRNNSNNTDPTNANLSGGVFRAVIVYEAS